MPAISNWIERFALLWAYRADDGLGSLHFTEINPQAAIPSSTFITRLPAIWQ
jgi:hypothetical protein